MDVGLGRSFLRPLCLKDFASFCQPPSLWLQKKIVIKSLIGLTAFQDQSKCLSRGAPRSTKLALARVGLSFPGNTLAPFQDTNKHTPVMYFSRFSSVPIVARHTI